MRMLKLQQHGYSVCTNASLPACTEEGAMDASNLLKPMLGRGELRCIGATTLDEYRKCAAPPDLQTVVFG